MACKRSGVRIPVAPQTEKGSFSDEPFFLITGFRTEYGVSPARPAPSQHRQDRKVAAAGGRSGAMQVAYPFFFALPFNAGPNTSYRVFFRLSKSKQILRMRPVPWHIQVRATAHSGDQEDTRGTLSVDAISPAITSACTRAFSMNHLLVFSPPHTTPAR